MDMPFIGQIELFPYNFAPAYWMLCNGRILQINQNQALFSLIGTSFGGDGRTTFGIPNLTGAAPINGTAYYISMNGLYPERT